MFGRGDEGGGSAEGGWEDILGEVMLACCGMDGGGVSRLLRVWVSYVCGGSCGGVRMAVVHAAEA